MDFGRCLSFILFLFFFLSIISFYSPFISLSFSPLQGEGFENIIPQVCLLINSSLTQKEEEEEKGERKGKRGGWGGLRLVMFGSMGMMASTQSSLHFCSTFFGLKRIISFPPSVLNEVGGRRKGRGRRD